MSIETLRDYGIMLMSEITIHKMKSAWLLLVRLINLTSSIAICCNTRMRLNSKGLYDGHIEKVKKYLGWSELVP